MPRISRGIVDKRNSVIATSGARAKVTRAPKPPPPSVSGKGCKNETVATYDCPNVPVTAKQARSYSNKELYIFAKKFKKTWASAELARRSKKTKQVLQENCKHGDQWACSELEWRGHQSTLMLPPPVIPPPAVSTLPKDSTPVDATPPGTQQHPPLAVPDTPPEVNKSSNKTNNGKGLEDQPTKPPNPDADVPHSTQEERVWVNAIPTTILIVGVGGTLFLMQREQIPLNLGLAVVGVCGGLLVYKIYLQNQENPPPTITK